MNLSYQTLLCDTDLSYLILSIYFFLVILTLDKRKYLKFCHTERSEVSINLKYALNSLVFLLRLRLASHLVAFLQKAQNDKMSRHHKQVCKH